MDLVDSIKQPQIYGVLSLQFSCLSQKKRYKIKWNLLQNEVEYISKWSGMYFELNSFGGHKQ